MKGEISEFFGTALMYFSVCIDVTIIDICYYYYYIRILQHVFEYYEIYNPHTIKLIVLKRTMIS